MNINTKNIVSITEANQNFSKLTEKEQMAADEDVLSVSQRLIEKNRQAYEMLAE